MAKLKTWNEEGVKDLERLFALLGVPLLEAKQKYQFMAVGAPHQVKYKQGLLKRFMEVTGDKDNNYKMPDVVLQTFAKQVDNGLQFSAVDIAHCANSILEYPKNLSADIFKENAFKTKQDASTEQQLYERIVNREENFWAVFHEVLDENQEYIAKAIEVAIEYQMSIAAEVRRIIDGKQVKSCAEFRYCIISNQYFHESFLSNFLSIHKIATLLIEIYAEVSKPRPMAICVQDSVSNKHTVIGVMPSHSSTYTKKK